MYAIIETGGKQYKVAVGDKVKVEKLVVDEGGEVVFDKVIAVKGDDGLKAGAPYVEGAKKVLIVEEDLTAQLRELFAIHFDCHDKLLSLLQYDGTPFTTSTIVNKAKEVF